MEYKWIYVFDAAGQVENFQVNSAILHEILDSDSKMVRALSNIMNELNENFSKRFF